METVPTLCAAGCILGAAGVGCVFGSSAQTGRFEPALLSPDHVVTPHSSTLRHTRVQNTLPSSPFEPSSTSGTSESSPPRRPSHRSTPRHRKSWQEMDGSSIGNQDSASREARTPDSISGRSWGKSEDTHEPRRRPSSSLLKRLSSLSFSTNSSIASSERGLTRSSTGDSVSATSTASTRQENGRVRNKLVKRSLSHSRLYSPGETNRSRWHTSSNRLAYAQNNSDSQFRDDIRKGSNGDEFDFESARKTSSPLDATCIISLIVPRHKTLPTLCHPERVASGHDRAGTYFHVTDFGNSRGLTSNRSTAITGGGTSKSTPVRRPRKSLSLGNFSYSTPTSKPTSGRLISNGINRTPQASPPANVSDLPFNSVHETLGEDDLRTSSNRSAMGKEKNLHIHDPSKGDSLPRSVRSSSIKHHRTPPRISSSPTTPPSNISLSSHSIHSAMYSDRASSQPESEPDGKVFSSADEDETRSDTAYDSMRTGKTNESSSHRGPPLETLFDRESSPSQQRDYASLTTPSKNSKGLNQLSPSASKAPVVPEEESSTSTPGRTTIGAERRESRRSSDEDNLRALRSSSSSEPKALNLGQLAWDSDLDEENAAWSENSDDPEWTQRPDLFTNSDGDAVGESNDALRSVRRKLNFLTTHGPNADTDPRSNLFEWSEPAPVDRNVDVQPPPRPKTVHGKKNQDTGGPLSGARRAPSGLHSRSQSVPILADLVNSRPDLTSKFGTWGVGSKGVTEDWNEDFEFDDEASVQAQSLSSGTRSGMEHTSTMVVPDNIKVQQTNVLANIGLLKEWGMLIEELKDLRSRAIVLGIETSRFTDTFDEVDAMIDLADQEVENENVQDAFSPTSSPGFHVDDVPQPSPPPPGVETKSKNQEPNADRSTPQRTSASHQTTPTSEAFRPRNRSRKDSEAVAQSVIEALQKRRNPTYLATPDQPHAKKIPFDTRTLRKIVPHVNGLVKKVKHIIREAEGLHWSPDLSTESPSARLQQSFFTGEIS